MSIYEEVEFEDLDYDPTSQIYTYPCPCGDKFSISLEALWDGEDIATCPSCTLRIEIIYDEEDLPPLREEDDSDDDDDKEGGEIEKKEEEEKKEADNIDEGLSKITMKSLTVKWTHIMFGRVEIKNKLSVHTTEGTQILPLSICVHID